MYSNQLSEQVIRIFGAGVERTIEVVTVAGKPCPVTQHEQTVA